MKWFWLILALLVAAAIITLLQPRQGGRVDARAMDALDQSIDETVEAALAAPVRPPQAPAPARTPDATRASSPSDSPADLARDLLTERAEAAGTSPPPSDAAAASVGSAELLRDGLDLTIPNATVVPGRVVRQSDGSILADNQWVIRGEGTPRSPYIVSWDLLTSSMDGYQPRTGSREIPQRLALLDGKRVRVEGYLAFPLVSQQTKQLLVTQNQWDGCCIGVPPTPYDAVEVTLDPLRARRRGVPH
jgi:hypothetical protein